MLYVLCLAPMIHKRERGSLTEDFSISLNSEVPMLVASESNKNIFH